MATGLDREAVYNPRVCYLTSTTYNTANTNSISENCKILATHDLLQFNQLEGKLFSSRRIVRRKTSKENTIRRHQMKGYNVEDGYMGWWQGEYVLFASEADYRDAMEEE